RGKRNRGDLPPLTEAQILGWADAHRSKTGQWPTTEAGPVSDSPGETWRAINLALASGLRGLPGGDSLYWLLRRHRQVPGRRSPLERRGRKPAVRQRRRAAQLRARGLTYQEIADRLGVTKQD